MRITDGQIMVPAGGWSYPDPDTGFNVTAVGPFELLRTINEHREYRGKRPISMEMLESYFSKREELVQTFGAKVVQNVAGRTVVG